MSDNTAVNVFQRPWSLEMIVFAGLYLLEIEDFGLSITATDFWNMGIFYNK